MLILNITDTLKSLEYFALNLGLLQGKKVCGDVRNWADPFTQNSIFLATG